VTHSTGSEQADIRVISPDATPEDVAAVTVVVTQALAELADDLGADARPAVSAWQRSQRQLRTPLVPGPGAWRGFSA
jgi:hypothetical protein